MAIEILFMEALHKESLDHNSNNDNDNNDKKMMIIVSIVLVIIIIMKIITTIIINLRGIDIPCANWCRILSPLAVRLKYTQIIK